MPVKPVILIIDDETTVANITSLVLSKSSEWEVVVMDSSTAALDVIRNREVAVLLSDLKMPDIDGAAVIKRAALTNSSTVCILVTAFATKQVLIDMLNTGILWRCLEKPWLPQELYDLVSEAVKVYQGRKASAAVSPALFDKVPPAPPMARERQVRKLPLKSVKPQKLPLKSVKPQKKYVFGRTDRSTGHHNLSRLPVSIMSPAEAERFLKQDQRYHNPVFLRQGGTGILFKARDSLLDMPVAIKILTQDFANISRASELLIQESRAAMQLSHKHIVRLHNIQQSGKIFYLVMEYIDGCTLRDLLDREGRLPLDTVAKIVDICEDAIGYAHRHDVLHRDIKPDNFMVSRDGILKIIDFGLACLANVDRDTVISGGTPCYISPEDIRGDYSDRRSDLYSLAITLHELLVGRLPLPDGQTRLTGLVEFVPQADRQIPEALRNVLAKAFAARPDDRWPDIHAFAVAFRAACRSLEDAPEGVPQSYSTDRGQSATTIFDPT